VGLGNKMEGTDNMFVGTGKAREGPFSFSV